jgi:N-dimethylarginine dimethylaminohydrolase
MHLLMCPPKYFDVSYEINPWMHLDNRPDHILANRQWDALYRIITERIGAQVSLIEPPADVPDMVFTANAGLVVGKTFIPSTFRFHERELEMPYFRRWFAEHGYVEREVLGGPFEGEGDALFYGNLLMAGFGPRSLRETHARLAELVGRDVLSLGLVDGRYYHLDVCFAPLTDTGFIYYPPAFDDEAQLALDGLPGEKLAITDRDADHFGANAVVIGHDVVVNSGAQDLAELLTRRGFRVHATDLSEFVKAGGSAKCLTLILEP